MPIPKTANYRPESLHRYNTCHPKSATSKENTDMISQDLLDLLRCPLDPSNTRLESSADGLVCLRCRLAFPVREGIPCMLVEDAILPPGCASVADLPCQKKPAEARTPS